jgi:hypothetical protein
MFYKQKAAKAHTEATGSSSSSSSSSISRSTVIEDEDDYEGLQVGLASSKSEVTVAPAH